MTIWNTLLQSHNVRTPKKALLIVNSTPAVQQQFIKYLYIQTASSFLTSNETNTIANAFSLGYTYINFKDESNEVLSTLEIYTLVGEYIESTHKETLEGFSKRVDTDELLIVNLLDYNKTPRLWLRQTQAWDTALAQIFNTTTLNSLKKLTVVVNKSSHIDIEQDVHEVIQTHLRIQAIKLHSSLIYIPSLSNTAITSTSASTSTDSFKSSRQDCIKLISHILQLPIKSINPSTIEPNLMDYSTLLIPQGRDNIKKIEILHEDAQSLYGNYTVTEPLEDNKAILRFEEALAGVFKDDKSKGKLLKKSLVKPNDLHYQDFLDMVYQNRNKEPEEIEKIVLTDF